MTRHKKFIKSEKAKTKLKGAKLPKGLNVTKTDFKIKKIVIREQLKDSTTIIEDGSVIRNQNIKELLSKLQHHNTTNRNEGLRHLKELLTNCPQEASKHLGSIIKGISQLCLDVEKDVRRESFKALNLVFATQTPALISPFFNVVSSYLRCAMTHINTQIQEDSLFMLDCLLLYTPSLVATNSDAIFSCFLDMISKLRVESKPERTLTLNLGSKMTNVKWRSKVLDRLLGILKAIVDNHKNQYNIDLNVGNIVDAVVEDAFKLPNYTPTTGQNTNHQLNQYFDPVNESNFSIIRRSLNRNCELSFLFKRSNNSSTTTATNLMSERDEGKRIRKYTELLMPLLFETWMEVRPANLNNLDNDDILISNEAAFSLRTVVEIIEQLYELMKMWNDEVNNDDLTNWFEQNYGNEFCAQFLLGFPYLQCDGVKSSKRKSKGLATEQEVYEAGGHRCFVQNLYISYIFCCLNRDLSQARQQNVLKIIEFLKSNIRQFETQKQEVSEILLKLLQTVLIENGEHWLRSGVEHLKVLLRSLLTLYQQGKFSKEIRTKVLILLCDIVLSRTLYKLYGNEIFTTWLSTLPKLLCQPFVSQHVLKTLSCLAKQQNEIFLKNLEHDVPHIIDNLTEIQISGIDNQDEGKRSIINLFFWLKSWEPSFDNCSIDKSKDEYSMIVKLCALRKLQ